MDDTPEIEYTRLDRDLVEKAMHVLALCKDRGLHVVTAESCTGGLLAGVLTEAPGASDVVDGGFVTYSNTAKEACLGVPETLLKIHGAVSEAVARAMAEGALKRSPAELAVSITGIAGPGGATEGKPVGLVHFGAARRDGPRLHRECRFGDIGRGAIRRASIVVALEMLAELASS